MQNEKAGDSQRTSSHSIPSLTSSNNAIGQTQMDLNHSVFFQAVSNKRTRHDCGRASQKKRHFSVKKLANGIGKTFTMPINIGSNQAGKKVFENVL
ncbi:hypothetical protein [Endozoicomonas atrinae]|uniref:hypothetical protein n=1 Tax=Endozoicomonas atrinae TaxID=1333660 RepID=UPI000826B704|nr:hypothetical protein [Endozoicomonas atrinae]